MSDPFLGEIIMFAGNFAPRGWAFCDGQLLPIAQYSALFSILGTTYGGDGETTFGLPDLRGRVPMHPGNGPGLSPRVHGEKGGAETALLSVANLPPHGHSIKASNGQPDETNPEDRYPATLTKGAEGYAETSNSTMKSDVVTNTGSGTGHPNVQPFQCVNFIIALQGVFPSPS